MPCSPYNVLMARFTPWQCARLRRCIVLAMALTVVSLAFLELACGVWLARYTMSQAMLALIFWAGALVVFLLGLHWPHFLYPKAQVHVLWDGANDIPVVSLRNGEEFRIREAQRCYWLSCYSGCLVQNPNNGAWVLARVPRGEEGGLANLVTVDKEGIGAQGGVERDRASRWYTSVPEHCRSASRLCKRAHAVCGVALSVLIIMGASSWVTFYHIRHCAAGGVMLRSAAMSYPLAGLGVMHMCLEIGFLLCWRRQCGTVER
jgi:hypothetical protein